MTAGLNRERIGEGHVAGMAVNENMTDDEVGMLRSSRRLLNCGTGRGCSGRGVGMDVW